LKNRQFGYLISQTRKALFAALDKEMLPLDLTASQFVVVIGAMRNRARTVNEFCQLPGIEPGPMSRLLDRIEAEGIVRKVRDLDDRGQLNVTLTRKRPRALPADQRRDPQGLRAVAKWVQRTGSAGRQTCAGKNSAQCETVAPQEHGMQRSLRRW
jgi:DNA-binding MarR family transcriptional regulator